MAEKQAVRLTQYARGGGCACKIPPGELEEAVARLIPERRPDDVLIGVEHGDDAAVVRISPTRAVVATTRGRSAGSRRPTRSPTSTPSAASRSSR
jgi:selenide,water dikinase